MLIAAYHVLHRLQAPNHPPTALSSLTKIVDPLALQLSKNNVKLLNHKLSAKNLILMIAAEKEKTYIKEK